MGFALLEGGCRVLLQGVEVAGRSLIILQQVKKKSCYRISERMSEYKIEL